MKIESFGVIPIRKGNPIDVFLVLHRSGNYWSFPKGGKHQDETPHETAVRELKEETGLQVVKFIPLPSFVDEYSFFREALQIEKRVEYFLATVTGDMVLQKNEILEGNWFPIEEAVSKITFAASRLLCQKLLKKEVLEALSKV